jgi:hypothetical protein
MFLGPYACTYFQSVQVHSVVPVCLNFQSVPVPFVWPLCLCFQPVPVDSVCAFIFVVSACASWLCLPLYL